MGFQTAFPIPFMYQIIIAVILNLCAGSILSIMQGLTKIQKTKSSHTD